MSTALPRIMVSPRGPAPERIIARERLVFHTLNRIVGINVFASSPQSDDLTNRPKPNQLGDAVVGRFSTRHAHADVMHGWTL